MKNKEEKAALKKEFGLRLLMIRHKKELKQKELAELSSIDSACLSRFEKGHIAPSFYNLICLSKALNVSVDFLMGIKERDATLTDIL